MFELIHIPTNSELAWGDTLIHEDGSEWVFLGIDDPDIYHLSGRVYACPMSNETDKVFRSPAVFNCKIVAQSH